MRLTGNTLPIRFKHREMIRTELLSWEQFKLGLSLDTLTDLKGIRYVCTMYSDVFSKEYWQPEGTNDTRPIIRMIDKLDKVYNKQNINDYI